MNNNNKHTIYLITFYLWFISDYHRWPFLSWSYPSYWFVTIITVRFVKFIRPMTTTNTPARYDGGYWITRRVLKTTIGNTHWSYRILLHTTVWRWTLPKYTNTTMLKNVPEFNKCFLVRGYLPGRWIRDVKVIWSRGRSYQRFATADHF